jgi:ribonuclease P protein component
VKQSFSSIQRLHQQGSFEKALKNKAMVEKWLALHFQQNSFGHDRLGIIISKRFTAKATDRNRIKRYIREAFRVGSNTKNVSFDIVVRLRKQVLLYETPEFRQTMSRLLMKVRMTDHDTPVFNVHKKLSVPD